MCCCRQLLCCNCPEGWQGGDRIIAALRLKVGILVTGKHNSSGNHPPHSSCKLLGCKFEGGRETSTREEELFLIWIIVENLAWTLRHQDRREPNREATKAGSRCGVASLREATSRSMGSDCHAGLPCHPVSAVLEC